jgi:hypothetical protein
MARTVAEVIDYLKSLPQDEYIAVPFIWTKADGEEWQEIDLTTEEWQTAIDSYESDNNFLDDSAEVMAEALSNIEQARSN